LSRIEDTRFPESTVTYRKIGEEESDRRNLGGQVIFWTLESEKYTATNPYKCDDDYGLFYSSDRLILTGRRARGTL
jgi:hypothetical protein